MKVRRYFVDAETGRRYEKGDTFKGRPERMAELQASGYLMPGPTETPTAGPAETKTSTEGVSDGKPSGSTSRKPADRRPARKR